MAKSDGGDGKNTSKFVTPEQHATARADAKKRKMRQRSKGLHNETMTGNMRDEVRKNRFLYKLQGHIRISAAKNGWSQDQQIKALHYAQDLVLGYGPDFGILHDDVAEVVRFKFTVSCLMNNEHDLPGQNENWYPSYVTGALKFIEKMDRAKGNLPIARQRELQPA